MREVKFIRPKSLADAVQIYRATPECRPLAGGTDLMVMLHARTLRPAPQAVLDLWSLAELKGVRRVQDTVEIGAAESYAGIIASRDVQQHLPALAAAARTIGAAQIQNRGTLGAQAISKIVMAVSRQPARIAIGSVAELPLRARRAEVALERNDIEGAIAAVGDDIRPIDDVRSTAAYRRAVTQNVLRELLDAFARG